MRKRYRNSAQSLSALTDRLENMDNNFKCCKECGAPLELGHEQKCSQEPKLPKPIKIKSGAIINTKKGKITYED